jgi:hypothetical protein
MQLAQASCLIVIKNSTFSHFTLEFFTYFIVIVRAHNVSRAVEGLLLLVSIQGMTRQIRPLKRHEFLSLRRKATGVNQRYIQILCSDSSRFKTNYTRLYYSQLIISYTSALFL